MEIEETDYLLVAIFLFYKGGKSISIERIKDLFVHG